MRKEFIRCFRECENEIRYFPRDFLLPLKFPYPRSNLEWLIQVLDKEAAEISESYDVNLRSDAFVFLITNLQFMVIGPWLYARGERFPDPELIELLHNDIRILLREVAQQSLDEKQDEISANAVLRIVASLGDKLKIRTEELWGP